jgi:hypothetical protein
MSSQEIKFGLDTFAFVTVDEFPSDQHATANDAGSHV